MILIIKIKFRNKLYDFDKLIKRYIVKTLIELEKNKRAIILKVIAKGDLRERLISFGVTKGSEVELKHCSPNCENLEIDVDGVFVALRKDEAHKIFVGDIDD